MGAVTDIYYVTYATTGNAVDFGDLAQSEEADRKWSDSKSGRDFSKGSYMESE